MLEYLQANLILTITGVILLVIAGYVAVRLNKRFSLIKFLKGRFKELDKANQELARLTNFESLYLDGFSLYKWKASYSDLYEQLDVTTLNRQKPTQELILKAQTFADNYANVEYIRDDYNERFVEYELAERKEWFGNIMGHSLDQQQREAVIKNEDNCLIVAGAGTGKTLTLSAKVAYLVDRYGVDPSELQLISFTNKSCDEMKERIKNKLGINVDVRTFNKLGYDIIKTVDDKDQPNVSDLDRNQINQLIQSIFESLVDEDESYQSLLNEFFLKYLKPYKSQAEFDQEGEYFSFLKDYRYYGFKVVENENEDGDNYRYRERYKSLEEVEIANFLLFNNINFEYETDYKYKTASKEYTQYQPDFYLSDYDIYIEHFGINKAGNVPGWFKGTEEKSASEVYQDSIKWKRHTHKIRGTKLIETYSWMKQEDNLTDSLKELLQEAGVELEPMSPEEIWKIISSEEVDEVQNFTVLLHNFLVLAKESNVDIEEIKQRLHSQKRDIEVARKFAFVKIYEPVYKKYQEYLASENEIDFADMINLATDYVNKGLYKPDFKYLLIDEFQDISIGRYRLVNSLLKCRPAIKLFCVGDDWQSIYRFTGSDIAIFTEFDTYFKNREVDTEYERRTVTEYIEQTYRFGKPLIDLSSEFILKNSNQVKKKLKSDISAGEEKPYTIVDHSKDEENRDPIERILSDIKARLNRKETPSILFLGRYNHDRKVLEASGKVELKWERETKSCNGQHHNYPSLKLKFLTVHAAKGLEADYVILLNLTRGKYGFPSEIVDDPILELVLSGDDDYPNSEERRVFYVALTRAKRHLYFLVNKQNSSKFISELVGEKLGDDSTQLCPNCKTGILLEREGKYGKFVGCSNYPFCEHSYNVEDGKGNQWEAQSNYKSSKPKKNSTASCPSCKKGVLRRKYGKYGTFLGCSRYPDCDYTKSVKDDDSGNSGSVSDDFFDELMNL